MNTLRDYLDNPTVVYSKRKRVTQAYITALENAIRSLLFSYPEQAQETFESCVKQALSAVDNESEAG